MKKENFSLKCFFILVIIIFAASVSFAETYVSIEFLIIIAQEENKYAKLIALEYFADAIERGNRNDGVLQALDFLVNEHRKNPIMADGQVTNDFPDVRKQAVRCLGMLGTIEARDLLLEILVYEHDESVLQEIANSLDSIEIN